MAKLNRLSSICYTPHRHLVAQPHINRCQRVLVPLNVCWRYMDAAWQRCLDSYLQTIEDRSGSVASRATYASTLNRFLATVPDPALVSRADVLDFLQLPSTSNRNHGKPVSAATKNQRVTIIRSFYSFASGYQMSDTALYTRALPTIGISRLKPSVAYYSLNADGLERLFAVIPQDHFDENKRY